MTMRWWFLIRGAYHILVGDHAYDVYLSHWQANHADQGGTPLTRREFFRERTLRKGRGVHRCC